VQKNGSCAWLPLATSAAFSAEAVAWPMTQVSKDKHRRAGFFSLTHFGHLSHNGIKTH